MDLINNSIQALKKYKLKIVLIVIFIRVPILALIYSIVLVGKGFEKLFFYLDTKIPGLDDDALRCHFDEKEKS